MQITAAAAFSHLGLCGRCAGPKPCPDRGHGAPWQGGFLPKTPITPALLWPVSWPKQEVFASSLQSSARAHLPRLSVGKVCFPKPIRKMHSSPEILAAEGDSC